MKTLVVLALIAIAQFSAAFAEISTIVVRDRSGKTVAGSEIEILAGTEIAKTTVSGEDGTVVVTLEPGTYRARATAPGFVTGFSVAFVPTADKSSRVEVSLFPGTLVAATVLDDQDKPVPEADICLTLHDWRRYPPAAFGEDLLDKGRQCFEADAKGKLITVVLPLGEYDLSIEADPFVPRRMTLNLETDLAVQIWRLKRGGRIKGRVEDQQEQPVQSATLRLRHRELEVDCESMTDAEGRFDISGLSPGPWLVRVEPPRAALIVRDGTMVKEGVATDLGTLRARPGLPLEGVVIDGDGEPVAGVEIDIRAGDRTGRPLRKVISDDEGRFVVIGLGDDPVNLLVDAPEGHASTVVEKVTAPRRDLEIELQETGSVCGSVQTEDGDVPAGVSVTALPLGLGLLDRYQKIVRSTTREIDPETGAFCLQDVHPGERVPVSAGAPGYQGRSSTVEIHPGQSAGPVDLTLRRGLSLVGRVLEPDGRPLADASVGTLRGSLVFTDSFGEFHLSGLSAGMETIVAEHPDYSRAQREIMLPLREDEVFAIELDAGGAIAGTVRRSGGDPVEGVPIGISISESPKLTDSEGRFRFEHVPPGECRVTRRSRKHRDDFEHRSVDVVADETVNVEFTLGVTLEGQVLRDGAPVPGASIALAQPADVTHFTGDHGVKRTYADETGTFRLAGVRAGWGTATVEIGNQTVVRPVEIPPGDQPRLDVYLPNHRITGVVLRAADETGVAGAQVFVTLAAPPDSPRSGGSSSYTNSDYRGGISYNLTTGAESRTTTEATGHFETFADALPEISVHAFVTGFRSANVKTSSSSQTPVELRLFREVNLLVKLRDASDRPVQGADVCAKRQTENGMSSSSCTMDGSDVARFSLDEGHYKIIASAAGFGTKVLERDLKRREDGTEQTIVVHLVPGAPLDIRLVGQAAENARVASLIDPAGNERTDLVRESSIDAATGDRRWATWSLDPGLWTVSVDPGSGDPLVREVEVLPGAAIEVVLP